MKRESGLGSLPAGLLRSTLPHESEPVQEPAEVLGQSAGQGGAAEVEPAAERPARGRRRRLAGGPSRGRKIQLPDELHRRLWLTAQTRGQSVSVVAAEALDRALPRWRVERE